MPGAPGALRAGGGPGEAAATGMSEAMSATPDRGVPIAPPLPGTLTALEEAARVLTLSSPAAQLRGTPGGRRTRHCWRCGERGHIYARCPLAASQEGRGGPRADARARGSLPMELSRGRRALTPPLGARAGRARAAAGADAAEPEAAEDLCKEVIASLDAALEAARVAMLAAHAVEKVLTLAEAGLSEAKQELADDHLVGHARLNVVLGNLADTVARFGAADHEGTAPGDYEAYCKASTAAVRRFKRVLGRATDLARAQEEAAEPQGLQPAGRPAQADGNLDGVGDGTQTMRTMQPSGEGAPGGW